jgi:hypothetical protein
MISKIAFHYDVLGCPYNPSHDKRHISAKPTGVNAQTTGLVKALRRSGVQRREFVALIRDAALDWLMTERAQQPPRDVLWGSQD